MIDLATVISHPETGAVRALGGSTGRRVSGVYAVLLPGRSRSLAGVVGDLRRDPTDLREALVVVMASEVVLDWHLDVLLRYLNDVGAAGLVVPGEESGSPMSSVELADRLGVGLLAAVDPRPVYEVTEAVLTNRRSRADLRVLDIVRIGADAAIDLGQAHARVAQRIGRDVLVFDSLGGVLYGLPRTGGDPDVGDQQELPDETREQLGRAARVHSALDSTPSGGVVELTWPGNQVLVAAPVPSEGQTTLWLGVPVGADIRADREYFAPLVEAAAVVCGNCVARSRLVEQAVSIRSRALLEELRVAEYGRIRPELRRKVAEEGWEFTLPHRVVRIALVGRPGAVDLVASLTPTVTAEFERLRLRANTVEQDSGWIVWFEAPPAGRDADAEEGAQPGGGQLVRQLRALNRRLRGTAATAIGMSSAREGLDGFALSLHEADDAAKIAATRAQSGHVVAADTVNFHQLLLAWTSAESFTFTVGTLLDRLDAAGASLKPTLAAYLDAESSLAETAATLGIHRNTVRDRIHRIEAVLDVDLTDPDARLALHLAVRAAELRLDP